MNYELLKRFLLAYLNSPTPKTLRHMQALSLYLVHNWNLNNFGLFFPNFGCHGKSLGSLENWGSIFEFTNYLYTLPYMLKIPWFVLHRIEICAILAYFRINLVAMANLLAPLKFQIAYLNSTTPKTYYSCEKVLDFFPQNSNWCIFCLFLPKFGCHGNSLGSLEISDSIFNFTEPKNITIRVKKSSIFCPELHSVHFCLLLPKFGCHDNSLGSLKISDSIWIRRPRKVYCLCGKVFDFFCAELKSVQFLFIFSQMWLPWQLLWLL